MLPPEDQKALKNRGFNYSGNKAISPLIRPLQNPFAKFFSSEAQPHRHQERDQIKNPRPIKPKATPAASNTRHYGSADAEERRRAGSSLKPKPKPTASNTRLHGSADAEERRHTDSSLKPKRTPTSTALNTRRYGSANAAEHWSKGSSPQPQLAISPRGEQNKNNALNQTSNIVKGTTVGAFVAERKLSYPIRIAPHIPENTPRAPYNGYGYHTGQIAPNSDKRLTSWQRQNVWRAMANDPKAPLTEVQRQQIRATPRSKSSAPTWKNPVTGKMERMELSHEPIPHRQGGQVVVPRWPEDHAARDPHRHLSRYVKNAYENQGDAIRRKFAEEVVVKEWGYKVTPSVLRGEKPPAVPQVSRPTQALKVLENSHIQTVARGASKVLAPVAVGLDAWQLGSAYQKDGFGQEFRKEAGRVAGGWGGAAAGAAGGAAIGSVVPVVGTAAGAIVGGVIGGVAGSEFGDNIEQGAEKAGKAIADGAKKAWNKFFG